MGKWRVGARPVGARRPSAVAVPVFEIVQPSIISIVFERPVTGLVVSSGVVAAVLGLAMQSALSDLFAGVAISIERPYRIGDWIELEGRVVGRVVDVTWRSTRLLSRTQTIYVLPNSKVLSSVLENISLPEKRFAHSIHVSLPPEVPPDLARRLLLDAALSCRRVLAEPPPVVRFWDVGTRPYQYLRRLREAVPGQGRAAHADLVVPVPCRDHACGGGAGHIHVPGPAQRGRGAQ